MLLVRFELDLLRLDTRDLLLAVDSGDSMGDSPLTGLPPGTSMADDGFVSAVDPDPLLLPLPPLPSLTIIN